MKKNVVLIFLLFFYSSTFFGQTLVRHGNQTITRDEFLRAYRKNNVNVKGTEKKYREYLDLYIRYRLKVQAAYDMKLDTLAGQITELQNFKSQIVDQYINDDVSLNRMAKEAFLRSQLDIRVSYIFVAIAKNAIPADTVKAWFKIQEAYRAIKENKDFGETAIQYSEDPYAKINSGDLNFVTVFDLPYAMETIAYNTTTGKFSSVFRLEAGYVILKKTAQRPAEGRIHVAQILLAFPYQATEAAKTETHHRADSIYQAIRAGADFGEMARKFSGDNLSYQLGGIIPEFGIGKYESGFEITAFGLKKDGDICEPYESSFGYHIIKRISRNPVLPVSDQKTLDELKEKIKENPRVSISRREKLQTILKQTKFKEFVPAGNILWAYTDSMIENKKPAIGTRINDQSILFQFPQKKYTVGDWFVYRKSLRSVPSQTSGKTNPEILDLYRQTAAFEYYKEHLENYNTAYAEQVREFRDGNLLFEIMQMKIWNKAAADSVGLKKYFESHTSSYWWQSGAEAIIFNATNSTAANKLQSDLEKNIRFWRKKVDSFGGQIQADSGRFELKQIPAFANAPSGEAGQFTPMKINLDKSVQFAYIIREYATPSPRAFEEARGLVINDYQNELENKWIDELKKKYPVVMNEAVFKSLPK